MEYTITQIFAPVVFKSVIKSNYENIFRELKSTVNFVEHCNRGCYSSTNFHILDDYDELKKEIKTTFDFFKDTILGYEETNFEITSSWMTKVRPGSISNFHNHKNCMYSGVLYFDDLDRCAPIEFVDTNLHQNSFMVNQVSKKNIYNDNTYSIFPEKNNIIFFPSHLLHRVGFHDNDSSRYSLAFNFMPDGIFGLSDSILRHEIF